MRHVWSEASRTEHETVRLCARCEIIRVTRHEPGKMPWTEFRRMEGTRLNCIATPPCVTASAFSPRPAVDEPADAEDDATVDA